MFTKKTDIPPTKQWLRKQKRLDRAKINSMGLRENYSHLIMEKIAKKIVEKQWKNIMLYHPTEEEVNCLALLPLLKEYAKSSGPLFIFLPRIDRSNTMLAEKIDLLPDSTLDTTQLEKEKRFGFLQPKKHSKPSKSSDIEVVIVPALAFDDYGYRLGYGGGHYDRFLLKHSHASIIGALYACQKTKKIAHEKHDIRLHAVSTEKRWYDFLSKAN